MRDGLLELAPGTVDPAAITRWLESVVSAAELEATPQDPGFHAEGNVWIHTVMAAQALVDDPRYAALDPAIQAIVATAVVLHDIGKPSTTRRDGERWTARGHSARGDSLARIALWQRGVTFGVREHICALIRHHQVPMFGITQPASDAIALARRLSLRARHDWLTTVALADARGRRCARTDDQTRIVEHCELWREHCRELGILAGAQPFASAHTRRVWCEASAGSRQPEVVAHDDTSCEVVVMSGLPASGKDHWLATHRPDLPVISLDAIRTELDIDPDESQHATIAAARERAKQFLRRSASFAWNATNLSSTLRGQLLELFRSYRARTHVVYCETPAAELHARNRARKDPVPGAAIARMLERWTVPDPSEAHEVSYVVEQAGSPPQWPPAPVAVAG